MKATHVFVIASMTVLLFASTTFAKDLTGKVGVGFNTQLTNSAFADSISGKFWVDDRLGFQAFLGFAFEEFTDAFNVGGNVLYKLIDEENMYIAAVGGLGLGYVDFDRGGDDLGFEVRAGGEIEYFLDGLPNLGFSTSIGLELGDVLDNTFFRTGAFLSVGLHYYFDLN